MPARSHNPRTPASSSRGTGARLAATPSSSAPETEDANDVTRLLSEISQAVLDDNDDDFEGNDLQDADGIQARLVKMVKNQKTMLKLGHAVGQHGNSAQIVQDARLTESVNNSTIKPIQAIKTSETVWSSKAFSKKLRTMLTLDCMEPDDVVDHVEPAVLTAQHFLTFLDEYAADIAPGLAPNLAVVHGASRDVVTRFTKTKTQRAEATQRQKPPTEKPVTLKKQTAREMDPTSDPTMQKVEDLYEMIQNLYGPNQTPIDVMTILIQPDSFQRSVEKFFCFSFLLKDAKVRMYLDNHNLPVCTPVARPVSGAVSAEDEEPPMEPVPDPKANSAAEDKFQTIMMNLTENTWRRLVEQVRRDETEDNAADSGMDET